MSKPKRDESRKEEAYSYRPRLVIDEVARVKKDPNKKYKLVRYDLEHDPTRVERYEQCGWEIVYTTEPLLDDRDAKGSLIAEESYAPRPVLRHSKRKDAAKFVYMCIDKNTWKQAQIKKSAANEDRIKRSTRSTYERRGNAIKIIGAEVNEQNMNTQLESGDK